jgi:predicted amidohydrolase
VATYRKCHLFGDGERRAFVPGETLCVAELAGVRVGVLICFDVEFPEPARALAHAGAEMLVTVAANMEPYGPDHALAVRARALDNRRVHLYVNRTGSQAGLEFVGGSAAIASDGSVLAMLGSAPGVVSMDLDVSATAAGDVDYLAHLRRGLRVEDGVPVPREGESR